MASSISYDSTIRDGLAVNPPLIASGGKIGAFAVLAHQIDWRQTTFADNNIMDYDGDSTTEKLLNAIESYICNHNMTGNVTGDVTGDVTGNTYGNTYGTVFGSAVNSYLTTIKQDTDHNSTYYISLVNKTTGDSYTYVDSDGLYYNPNTDTISTKNINATGNVTVTSNLTINGNTTLGNAATDTITVNGKTNFKQSVDIDSTLNVDGNETVTGNLTVNGNTTLNGNTTIGNAETDVITIKGDTTFNADVDIDKTLNVDGVTTLKGAVTLGDAETDAITVNGDTNFKADVDIDKTLNVDGNVTIGGKLSIDDATKVDNLNADMLDGMHISGINNKYWGTVTYVKSGDGVMEIGKYIDFHYIDGETDYSTRVSSQNTGTKNTVTLPTNDGTLHVGDFIKSDAGDKELDTTTSSSDGLKVLTGLSFDTTTGKVSYCTHDIYHGNSGIGAGLYGETANDTPGFGGTFSVPAFNVNAQGHITDAATYTITMPSQSHHSGSVTASTYNFVDKVELSSNGALSGTTKNTIANSNKIYVTTKSTAGSYYIPFFAGSGTEYKTAYIDSNLYYNPSTDVITSTGFNGALQDNLGTMKIYSELSNEINFGGTGTSDIIYIGYRTKDNKPVPKNIIFGGKDNSYTQLTVKEINIKGTKSSTAYIKSDAATNMYVDINGNVPLVIKYDDTDKFVAPGSSSSNLVNLGTSARKWANVFATTFNGALSGNASTADKLKTARNINLTGSVTGNANFDGSGNITISTTTNHTHNQYYDSGTSRTKNTVLAAPNGTNGSATFRSLVAADIPNLAASKITSGTFDIARIPTGTTATTVSLGNHTHEYLPKSGGTLTGKLSIETESWNNQFSLIRKNNGSNWGPAISFYADSTGLGALTMTNNELYVSDVGGTTRTKLSKDGHTHNFTPAGTVSVSLTHTATASTKASSNTTSVATGAHAHTTVNNGAHTHDVEGITTSNGSHTHTVSGTVVSNGAHTHTLSGTSSSNGAHTHTSNGSLSGSEASGVLTISFVSAATSSNGAHTHTYSATTSSAGSHAHTFSDGSAASAGSHIHDVEGGAKSAGSHGHTINANSSTVNIPNANHTHNYDKAAVQSASFSGDQGTTN